ncbi:LpqN/LpqT family lipoprotein [Mycobacterium decipiens]|nr:LpqN/LpqT family lipoprotein [Mycobacterium decipiens]
MVACGPKSPDFQSILSTSSTISAPPTTTEVPVPLWKYLEGVGVTGEPVAPNSLTDLTVSIPTPPGWASLKSPNIPPNTEVIAKGESFPTAMLMVFRLRGDFDVAEALKHGTADARLSKNFTELEASTADFNGFPSSMIQGSYDLQGRRLHAWNRIVFATGSPPADQSYLVQLTITSLANEAVEQASDIEAIIHGFVVAARA